MRQFNFKHGYLVPHPCDQHPRGRHAEAHGETDADPGRTIYPEPMRMAEDGWVQPNSTGESVQRREDHATDEELDAAREWLRHVEAGRIGGPG